MRYGALLLLVLAAACVSAPEIEPAPDAPDLDTRKNAAFGEVNGVRVVAQPNVWSGSPSVLDAVTPVRVVVENKNDKNLEIHTGGFALVTPRGKRYVALPLVEMKVNEGVFAPEPGFEPVPTPLFDHQDFFVAPYLAPVYSAIPPWEGRFEADSYYYERYGESLGGRDLPHREMLERGLPDGVLESAGRLEGYLFFEKVSPEEERLRFLFDLADATNGKIFGRIDIPFNVDEVPELPVS